MRSNFPLYLLRFAFEKQMLHSFCLFHKKRNGTANGMRNVYCIGVGFSRRSTMPDTTKNRSFLWGQFDRTVKTCGNKVLPDVPDGVRNLASSLFPPSLLSFLGLFLRIPQRQDRQSVPHRQQQHCACAIFLFLSLPLSLLLPVQLFRTID